MMGAGTEYRWVVRYDEPTVEEIAAYEAFQPEHGKLSVLVERDSSGKEIRTWPQPDEGRCHWPIDTQFQY